MKRVKRLKERSGSTSDIVDMLKRKRDAEENRREEEEAFRKSKIVIRSPRKGGTEERDRED